MKMKFCSLLRALTNSTLTVMIAHTAEKVMSGQRFVSDILICICIFVFRFLMDSLYDGYYSKEFKKETDEIMENYFNFPDPNMGDARLTQIFDNDLKFVINYETRIHPTVLINVPIILALFLLVLLHNSLIAGLILILTLMEAVLPVAFKKILSKNYAATAEIEERIESFYYIIIKNIQKCWFIPSEYFLKRLRRWNKEYYKIGSKSEITATLYNNLLQTVSISSQIGLYLIGFILMISSGFSFGEIVGVIYLGSNIMDIVSGEIDLIKSRPQYKVARDRIDCVYKGKKSDYKSIRSFECITYTHFTSPYIKHEISVSIHSGKVYVIKGDNGSGKTSLVKALMNIQESFTGKIKIDGEDICDVDMRNIIYYVPQDYLKLAITPRQLFSSDVFSQTKEMIKEFHFDETQMDQPINSMSGGEQKKVNLMCAFMSKKPLIILDEPENSLDLETRKLLINSISKSRETVLIISNTNAFDEIPHQEVRI